MRMELGWDLFNLLRLYFSFCSVSSWSVLLLNVRMAERLLSLWSWGWWWVTPMTTGPHFHRHSTILWSRNWQLEVTQILLYIFFIFRYFSIIQSAEQSFVAFTLLLRILFRNKAEKTLSGKDVALIKECQIFFWKQIGIFSKRQGESILTSNHAHENHQSWRCEDKMRNSPFAIWLKLLCCVFKPSVFYFPQGQKSWQCRQLIMTTPRPTTCGSSTG